MGNNQCCGDRTRECDAPGAKVVITPLPDPNTKRELWTAAFQRTPGLNMKILRHLYGEHALGATSASSARANGNASPTVTTAPSATNGASNGTSSISANHSSSTPIAKVDLSQLKVEDLTCQSVAVTNVKSFSLEVLFTVSTLDGKQKDRHRGHIELDSNGQVCLYVDDPHYDPDVEQDLTQRKTGSVLVAHAA